jgi:hypothetical protein
MVSRRIAFLAQRQTDKGTETMTTTANKKMTDAELFEEDSWLGDLDSNQD